MNIQIDAKGKQCPLPVIEAKNAISGMTEAGIVEVTVDNEIAVQNLTKMADHKGLKAKSEKKSDQEYTVWMEVTEEFVKNNIKDGNVSSTPVTGENCIPDIRKKKTVVVLGADHMGEGDDKLGKMLMKGFVYALTQLEELPQTILLFNSGAYLSCEGSDSVEDLKSMEAQGVEVMGELELGARLTKGALVAITGTNEEVLASLKGYCGRDELFDRGYEELSTVIKYLGGFGVAQENFKVDLTIARGLDYYTGTVYETALLDYPQIGSVCSGGRYDNLAEYYTDRKLPGVGISIGVTRLFYVLGEQGLLNDALNTAPADVLLLPMTEDLSFAVSLATRLRERGLRAQLYTENKKFKAKMNYADKTKIPYVLFLGEDEVASGVVTCKDMVTGEQTKGAPDEIIARIYAAIREKNAQKVIVEK